MNLSSKMLSNLPTSQIASHNKEGLTLIDPHCHTSYSDGSASSEHMLEYAKRNGFHIFFMDHNDIRAVQKHRKQMNCFVPGVEITSSTYNDFLIYFYNLSELEEFYKKEVEPNKISNNLFNFNRTRLTDQELLLAKERYNCKIVLPHPFAKKPKNSNALFQKNPDFLKKLDAVEMHNSIIEPHRNENAVSWVSEHNLSTTVGSDSHILETLGSALLVFEDFSTDNFLDSLSKKKEVLINPISNLTLRKSSFHVFKNNLKIRREYGFRFF